jgi:hypothetical protein
MNSLRAVLLLVLVASASATTRPLTLSAGQIAKNFSSKDAERVLAAGCKPFRTTADFPAALRAAFTKITQQNRFALANPGDRYQATDVVNPGDPSLPVRRLVFAGKCEGFWFIHYEQGGIGHSYAVVFFKDNPHGEPSFVWGGRGFTRARDINDLRSAITRKLFAFESSYW